jgi:hypothetical protein
VVRRAVNVRGVRADDLICAEGLNELVNKFVGDHDFHYPPTVRVGDSGYPLASTRFRLPPTVKGVIPSAQEIKGCGAAANGPEIAIYGVLPVTIGQPNDRLMAVNACITLDVHDVIPPWRLLDAFSG